jgi:hypothetical protein
MNWQQWRNRENKGEPRGVNMTNTTAETRALEIIAGMTDDAILARWPNPDRPHQDDGDWVGRLRDGEIFPSELIAQKQTE